MSPLFLCCFVAMLSSSVLSIDSYNDWIDPIKLNELNVAFIDVFDHNSNSNSSVSFSEIAIGIQSMIPYPDISFIPQTYSCIPSLDFVDFADCITISARQLINNDNSHIDRNAQFTFDDLYSKYIGKCDDLPPPNNNGLFCQELVERSPESCMMWSRTNQDYCKLSCYRCNEESEIFGETVRGLDGKYVFRNEKMETYSMPSNVLNAVKASDCASVPVTNHEGQILFVSDIHVEPWYNVDGTGGVSRFSGANTNNMFQCKDKSGNQAPCTCNGQSDPPFPLFATGVDYLSKHAVPTDLTKDLLIMAGDTQAHSYTSGVSGSETQTIPPLMDKVVDYMLSYFKSENIFYAAGNNDGQHDEIFCSGSDPNINAAWANVLIHANIVNNDLDRKYNVSGKYYDQTTLFGKTGYYLKQIPAVFDASNNGNFYSIVLNTNLGASNSLQNAVFNDDLEWIASQNNGHLIVIGHHPSIVPGMIPSKYQSMVRGSFSGHVHYFQPSDSKHFAILPATTQAAKYAAVMTGGLDANGNIVLTWDNFNQYLGDKNTLPAEDCWGYKGPQSI